MARKRLYEWLVDWLFSEFSSVSVVGFGSGSTVKGFISYCLSKGFLRDKQVVVASSDTLLYLYRNGFYRIADPRCIDAIDLYIDGADEVSSKLDLVKGRGAALFREKLLATRSRVRVYIVDYTKYTGKPYLYKKPIPVEIHPYSLPWIIDRLRLDGLFNPVLRIADKKDGPVVTDNGFYIVDLEPRREVTDPEETDRRLKLLHGVVETGIFPHKELVDIVVIGYPDKTETRRAG